MGDKLSATYRRAAPAAGRCLVVTTGILFLSCCTALLILLSREHQEPVRRDVPSLAPEPSRPRLTQVDTRGLGIQHVVLAGYHGGLPVVLNVWFRVLCAGSSTVVRGFATAEEAGGPLPVLHGHTLPPNAILMNLPQIYIQLSDGTRTTLTTWGPLEPGRALPRDTWHLQATFSTHHAAALIGVNGWDQTVQVAPQPRCHLQQQQQQQQQDGPSLGEVALERKQQQQTSIAAAPWMADGCVWGVLALPPVPTPAPPCSVATTTTATTTTSSSSSQEESPLASPGGLQEAVATTLSSLTAGGAAGLVVIATNPSHVAQLRAAPGLQDTPLRLWLWDGPLHLQHSGYATNAALNAALLAAWGTGARLLVMGSPGDTLVTGPGVRVTNASSPGGCLSSSSGQVHLTWSEDTPRPQEPEPSTTTATAARVLLEAPTADSSKDPDTLHKQQHVPLMDAAALKALVSPGGTTGSHPATLLDPDVTTCWHSGDAAVIPPRLANQLLLPSIAALQAAQQAAAAAAQGSNSNSSVTPGGTSSTLAVLYHTRETKGAPAAPPVVPVAPADCVSVTPHRSVAPGVTTPCPKGTLGGDTEAAGDLEMAVGSGRVSLAGPSSKGSSEGRKALQKDKPRVPKVALLFITQRELPLEPLWRAWLEAAGRVSTLDTAAAAAADADKEGDKESNSGSRLPPLRSPPATYRDALGPDRDLFPDLGVWEDTEYPWSKVQRGEWKTTHGIHDQPPPLSRPAQGSDDLQLSEAYLKSGVAEGWEPQVQAGMHSWEFWPVMAEQRRVWGEYQQQVLEAAGSSASSQEQGGDKEQQHRRRLMMAGRDAAATAISAGTPRTRPTSTSSSSGSSITSSQRRGGVVLEKGQLQLQPRGPAFLVDPAPDDLPPHHQQQQQQAPVEFAAGGAPGTALLSDTPLQGQQKQGAAAAAPTAVKGQEVPAGSSDSSTKAEGGAGGGGEPGAGTTPETAAAGGQTQAAPAPAPAADTDAAPGDERVTADGATAAEPQEGGEEGQVHEGDGWDALRLGSAPAPAPSPMDLEPAPAPTSASGPLVHPRPPPPPLSLLPAPEHPLYTGQNLFSVYVHALPGVVLPPGSVFSGRQLGQPLNTSNGYASFLLTKAIQRTLQLALQDPDNVKFAIMSESVIPLYHPKVLWAQLMSDARSFISACNHEGWDNDSKWHPRDLHSDHFNATHWRKSSTWSVLSRPHADLVAQEGHVMELFQRYCSAHDNNASHSGACTSDEIAVPSLLAAYNLSHQTNCGRDAQYTHWSGGWHPHSFTQPWEVSSSALHTWRTALGPPGKCDYSAAAASVDNVFQQSPGRSRRSSAAAATQASSWLLSPSAAQQYLGPGSWGAQPGRFGAWNAAEEEGDTTTTTSSSSSSSSKEGGPSRRLHEDKPVPDAGDTSSTGSNNSKDSKDSNSSSFPGQDLAAWLVARGYQPMDPTCSLFARKFKPGVVNATLALGLSCQALGLGHWCD